MKGWCLKFLKLCYKGGLNCSFSLKLCYIVYTGTQHSGCHVALRLQDVKFFMNLCVTMLLWFQTACLLHLLIAITGQGSLSSWLFNHILCKEHTTLALLVWTSPGGHPVIVSDVRVRFRPVVHVSQNKTAAAWCSLPTVTFCEKWWHSCLKE